MQVILIAIGIYLLYRFIFGFVIPVIQTTNRVKKQFNDMKGNINPDYNRSQTPPEDANRGSFNKSTSGKPGAKEDYIEFEELRWPPGLKIAGFYFIIYQNTFSSAILVIINVFYRVFELGTVL